MRAIHSVPLVGAVALITTLFGPPAQAEEFPPPDAVAVSAAKVARLQPGGVVEGSARVKCAPEWQAGDLSVQVDRSFTDYAQGITQPDVPCDDRWHRVRFTATTVSGTLDPGRVTISMQFVVTHVVFGDPAGAHDTTRGRLVRAAGR